MARSLKATVSAKIQGEYSNDSTSATDVFSFTATNSFTDGTAANKAQRWWLSEGRTLTAAQAEDIDMFDLASVDIGAGAGLDSLGQSTTFSGIKGILISVSSSSAGGIVVGNKNSAAAWASPFTGDTDAVNIGVGGMFLLTNPTAAGVAVADTANHLLTITDDGSGSTYSIGFLGID